MHNEYQHTKVTTNRNEEPPKKNVRRSTRVKIEPTRLARYERFPNQAVDTNNDLIEEVIMMAESEPINLDEAMNYLNWLVAMQEELGAIEKNKTCELVKKAIKKPINVKWVYRLKLRPNGEIYKHKERLVAKGFLQKPGIHFDEIYAHVAKLETIRIVAPTTSYKG